MWIFGENNKCTRTCSAIALPLLLCLLCVTPFGCSHFPASKLPSPTRKPTTQENQQNRISEASPLQQASYEYLPAKSGVEKNLFGERAVSHATLGTPTFAKPSDLENAQHTLPFFGNAQELSAQLLVAHVLQRNPTIAKMAAAWEAAVARYPQVTSLDDPNFGAAIGPASIGSNNVDFAYKLEVSQKIPFPGKLRLRGEEVMAKANAAGNNVDDVRLQLIESAKFAFSEYYLITRSLEINEESLKLLREFRKIAETLYKTGKTPQQDILQTDVEIGREQERRLNLEQMQKVAVARLNTLMHFPVDAPLPAPPKKIQISTLPRDVATLRSTALATRPDLQALGNQIAASEAALGLAYKDYYPDFELMAGYNWFWQEEDLRPIVGVRLNLPVQQSKRGGVVQEAFAKIAGLRAKLASKSDKVVFEVQEAYEQLVKSEKVVRLYEKSILPAAEANVKAAQAAYVTGKVPFLSLIEAQRNLINLRHRNHTAVAEFFSRHARLERVTGGPFDAMPAFE